MSLWAQYTDPGPWQVLLREHYTQSLVISPKNAIWSNSLMIPFYAASTSVFILFLHILSASYPCQAFGRWLSRLVSRSKQATVDKSLDWGNDQPLISQLGGHVIFGFKFAKFLGCLSFLYLALVTPLKESGKESTLQGYLSALVHAEWAQLAIIATATYISVLGLLSVTTRYKYSRPASQHLATVLLVTFSVFACRDLYPLLTFNEQPEDLHEGWLLWAKVAVLTTISIILPGVVPSQYVPVDPTNPSKFPHPEQTASWLSMSLYLWLDPIVFMAQRVSHLSHDKLPPLADHDQSRNLKAGSFPHMDVFMNGKKRHVFFGLMRVFSMEYTILIVLVILRVLSTLAAPVGINYLLSYLETSGKEAVIRPWVWIACIFFGQFMGSVIFQWYIFFTTRTIVRTECIITQLLFEHALRIRMKAEVPDTVKSTESTVSTPDSASIAESSTVAEGSPESSVDDAQSSSTSTLNSSTTKGKQKGKDKANDAEAQVKKSTSSADNLVGKINNLVTTDLGNITDGRDFLLVFPYIPLQVGLCIWFLYRILGWSAFVGLAVMICCFPLPGVVAKKIQSAQMGKMEKTDARVQTVTETMNVLRMVKLFGWEKKMGERISEKREVELRWTWKLKLLELVNSNINNIIPVLTMMACYSTYTVIMGKELAASRVFSSMTIFDILRDQLHTIFWMLPSIIQAKVSLGRVNDFLNNTELLDEFATPEEDRPALIPQDHAGEESDLVGFRDAVFAWSNEANTGTLTPSKRRFNLRIDDEVVFKRGCINLIVGPTGAGKTSMLMALLGEMHFMPSGPTSWFNLPRKGGVAYSAQESWVQNETIRDNILFGAPYDEARYEKVIYQCALKRDLELFEAGDRTEVGEKGLTLSGGQKARVTLARAVYSSAEILLLDDVLAALDVHTAKWIVDKCFAGDLIKNRTVILVTHNVAMASAVAQYVVSLNSSGRVVSEGTISEAIATDEKLAAEIAKEQEILKKEEEIVDNAEQTTEAKDKAKDRADGKLVMAEEILEGHVSWPAFKLYLASVGGRHTTLFWFAFLFFMVTSEIANITQTWFLGYWSSQYESDNPSEVDVKYYLTLYGVLLFLPTILYSPGYALWVHGSLRASRSIHKRLLNAILGTTLRWLDTTPTSRVITRCTQDIRAIDGPFAQQISWVIELTLALVFRLLAVVSLTPSFLLPGILVGVVGGWAGRIYMKAQLSIKREMSNAKAPVLGHFSAAIAGLTSIRAYGAQKAFQEESLDRIDRYSKSARMFYNLNRWICIRIDFIGSLFTTALAAYLVYGSTRDAANVGFSLNMAVGFSSMILFWVRILNDVEVNGNSIERINSYIKIEQEPKASEGGQPPAYWPASGALVIESLSARYSSDGPKVLHDLNCKIESGERVGIVGRTGSGKSSLTLSLLRCIPTEGTIYFDGVPTSAVNLDALRSHVTIIPQIPELLSGTLRQNLDPFDQYDDAILNDALRSAGLWSVQEESDDGRLTLDSAIASGGGNLSVGQRQILALARAMVRGSKLLILDEATSAIDYKTDTAIQSSLRHEMQNVTQIIIAHRLQSIIDADKIMVLDAGRIVEFGSPQQLLRNEKGMFRALVDESGDKALLYAMAAREISAHGE
ncbi:P-loop containing nucleoside triphosphate hydrolase protein [Gyrodon lividus]|nr:P-loop containing nucleoside triphosphate hydrolase protein [Gyrodon lividus]